MIALVQPDLQLALNANKVEPNRDVCHPSFGVWILPCNEFRVRHEELIKRTELMFSYRPATRGAHGQHMCTPMC